MRLLWSVLLLFDAGIAAMSVIESYERHLNDLTPPALMKTSPRDPMRVKRYKCVEEYVDLPVSSTSESLSLFSRPLPPLSHNTDNNEDGEMRRVEADHGVINSGEFSFDPAPPAVRHRAVAAAVPIRNPFDEPQLMEPQPPSPPTYSPQFLPPSFAISNSPFIQLPPPNTIASSRPVNQIRVPPSTGRSAAVAAPPSRPVQHLQQKLHSGGRSLDGDRHLPDIDFSLDDTLGGQPLPPPSPPVFSATRPTVAAAAAAAGILRLQSPHFLSISPTPLPPLPDFGVAPRFTISRNTAGGADSGAQQPPDLLAHPHQSDMEDISVVPLSPSDPARGPKAIMRSAGKKHLPLTSNESEDSEEANEFVYYNSKAFRTFNRNSTRPNFKSAEPSEKMWAFSSWKAEEV